MWLRILGVLAVVSSFFAPVRRAGRQLFHETTGTLFAVLALVGASAVWREWRRSSPAWLLALAAAFTVMMAGFAVAAFRSARRVGNAK